MLTGEIAVKLVKVIDGVMKETADIPEQLFVSLIATIVDTWAEMHNFTGDDVIEWYKSIIELKPEVDRQMEEEE